MSGSHAVLALMREMASRAMMADRTMLERSGGPQSRWPWSSTIKRSQLPRAGCAQSAKRLMRWFTSPETAGIGVRITGASGTKIANHPF